MDEFNFFKTSMPDTRKADFYLGCLEGSVFIDFNKTGDGQISLVRISFDGYGCCNLDKKAELLTKKESTLFIEQLSKEQPDQDVITALVKRAIKINQEHIWNDALEEYKLLEKNVID